MNAIHTLAGRPARWLALAALAALLALAAALALNAAQPAGAQESNNAMQTGMDNDRSNFRLELSLVDDSDGTVPAGSSARLRAVLKFDVPKGKTNGIAMSGADDPDHGDFGTAFNLQGGGTLRIAGPYEWENAGGRTLRIDANRMGFTDSSDSDPASYGDGCPEDWGNDYGRVEYAAGNFVGSATACADPYPIATPATAEDWKSLAYSQKGYIGNSTDMDLLDDRDSHQGWCSASTTDDVTTWSCELPLIDEQFGWKGNNAYATYNGNYDATIRAGSTAYPNTFGANSLDNLGWSLAPLRRDINARDGSITIPTGTPDGSFTVSASISFHSRVGVTTDSAQYIANTGKVTVTDSLTVNIGTVAEAQSASLDFATQTATSNAGMASQAGQPWPSVVAATDAVGTRFSLSVLNANGKASAKGSVSAIALRTNFGLLDSSLGCKGRESNARTLTCEIDTANLDTSNYGNIPLQLLPPANDKAGTATVQGFLLTTSGDSIQLGPLEVTFTGAASAITISEPTSSILNTVTPAADNRDQLTLSVSAADASDNRATVPTRRPAPTLKDPDDKTVNQSTAGISVAWPLLDDDNDPILDAQGNLQTRITVSAAAASALKTGVYTLTLRAGSLTATQTFTVAGEAAAIEVATSETDYAPNARFTLTATVSNADGSAVPDGTPVVWAEPQPTARLVRISGTTATKGGEASATYVVIGEGRAWITLTSGAGTGFWSENVGAPAQAPASANPADELSARAGFASYLGTADTTASALLGGLGNVTSIRIWQLDRWVLYAVIDGVSPPDAAEDFTVSRGAVLWIGS